MLKPAPILKVQNDRSRMWMLDDYLELIVWFEPNRTNQIANTIYGFQLCYDKIGIERALTWIRTGVFTHSLVSESDSAPGKNLTQMLMKGGVFDQEILLREFTKRSKFINAVIRSLVIEKIKEAKV